MPSFFDKFLNKFRWSKIFAQNVKRSVLLIAIPLILINIFSSVYYYRNISMKSSFASAQMHTTVSNTINNILNETNDLFNTISAEHGVDILMQTDDITSITSTNVEPITKLRNLMENQVVYSDFLRNVSVYSYRAKYHLSTDSSGTLRHLTNTPWLDEESDQLCFGVNGGDTFFLCYNVVNYGEKQGLIIFEIDPAGLASSFEGSLDKDWSVALYNSDSKVFYSTGIFTKSLTKLDSAKADGTIEQHNKYTVITSPVNDMYLKLHAKHKSPLYTGFVIITILMIALIIFISFVIAYVLTGLIYNSLKDIGATINDVAITEKSEGGSYEGKNLLAINDKNNLLEQELVKSFVNLKKMQTQILQMQFTPHFLFNALNTLNASLMLRYGVNNPHSRSIEAMAHMVSSSIDVTHYIIPVSEEIEHCKKYISIQSMISNNNFKTNWNISDEAENLITIKFSLQPLIENAFKHGIRHLHNKTDGVLNISAFTKNEHLIFEIENNGPQPDESTVSRLNSLLESGINSDENHIGLFNVNKRIKLVFGEEYGCTMSTRDNLTVLTVKIPKSIDKSTFEF